MKIEMIGMPMYYGSDRPGVECGPESLMNAEIVKLLERKNHQVVGYESVEVPFCEEEKKYLGHDKMKFFNEILESNNALCDKVYQAHKNGHWPLIIGGDHALAIGSISGTAKYNNEANNEDFAVVWIDAHADINTFKTSDSHNVHGMPLASLMGFGNQQLMEVGYKGVKVKTDNVFIFAARDIDSGEKALIEDKNISVFSPETMRTKTVESICITMQQSLKNKSIQNIHISLDIDALDASLVPGTGTPVKNGLTAVELENLLHHLFDKFNVISMDLVEFNPKRDKDDITLKSVLKIIEQLSEIE